MWLLGGQGPEPKPIPGEEDLPSIEVAKRRSARADEQATRTARTLYGLQQQVKDIQSDLNKVKPTELKGNKKVRFPSRV